MLHPLQGRQFDSCQWKELMRLLGSKRIHSTAYHPSSNGLVERFHRLLKAGLKAQTNLSHWSEMLPLILLGIRSALKEDVHCTAAELVYGTILRLPGEFFTSTDHTMQQLQGTPARKQPQLKSYISKDLGNAKHVFVRHDAIRKPLQPPYDGPTVSWSEPTSITRLTSLGVQKSSPWIDLNQLISKAILSLTLTRPHRRNLQRHLRSLQ